MHFPTDRTAHNIAFEDSEIWQNDHMFDVQQTMIWKSMCSIGVVKLHFPPWLVSAVWTTITTTSWPSDITLFVCFRVCILATSKVISKQESTWGWAHSWWLYSAASLGDWGHWHHDLISHLGRYKFGKCDKYKFGKSLIWLTSTTFHTRHWPVSQPAFPPIQPACPLSDLSNIN